MMGISYHMGNQLDCFIHQTYGRVRIRVPALRSASQRGDALVKTLAQLKGIRKISISEVTGSVVIYYDPNRQHMTSILKAFHSQKLLVNVVGFPHARALPPPPRALPPTTEWLSVGLQHASKAIFLNLVESTLQKTSRLLIKKIFS